MENKDRNDPEKQSDNPISRPDPETLHTTDPQKKMEGPVSSSMHSLGEAFETDETEREADEKKDRNL